MNTVHFVGAGSGAPDLITVRGMRLLKEADVIVYAGSLVNPELLSWASSGCEIYDSAYLHLEQVIEIMERAVRQGKKVVRLHTGDPSIYGAIREQIDLLEERGIDCDVCPGVSSFQGAAASLQAEYTLPGVSQTVILTRLEGRTPVPEREKLKNLASHGASMAIFLSAAMAERLQRELLDSGGYDSETPCAVVFKATWPEEKKFRTTLGRLAETMKESGIRKTAIILVGDFLEGEYQRSRLYDRHFSTEFRKAEGETGGATGFPELVSSAESPKSAELSESAGATELSAPEADAGTEKDAEKDSLAGRDVIWVTAFCYTTRAEELAERVRAFFQDDRQIHLVWRKEKKLTEEIFQRSDLLLFFCASGIAVRQTAPFVKDKAGDPAALVLGEDGKFVISLLSGHLGGANEYAERISASLGAVPVITTASDARLLPSLDSWASKCGLAIDDMKLAKRIMAEILDISDSGGVAERTHLHGWFRPEEPYRSAEQGGRKLNCSAEQGGRKLNRSAEQGGGELNRSAEQSGGELNRSAERGGREESSRISLSDYRLCIASDRTTALQALAAEGVERRKALILEPRRYAVGVGCRKDCSPKEMEAFLRRFLEENGLESRLVGSLASVSRKAEEACIKAAARSFHVPYTVYSKEDLLSAIGDFSSSDFVYSTVGVDNVCERSAVLAAGQLGGFSAGEKRARREQNGNNEQNEQNGRNGDLSQGRLIVKKTSENGMTVAAAVCDVPQDFCRILTLEEWIELATARRGLGLEIPQSNPQEAGATGSEGMQF